MGTTSSYTVWFTIRISHEYYSGNKNGIELLPAGSTLKILQKEDVLIKPAFKSAWSFLRQGTNTYIPLEIKDDLEFYIKPVDAGFYYFTDNENRAGEGWQIKDPDRGGAWKTLTVSMDDKAPAVGTTFDITLGSAKKFFEFIVINKTGAGGKDELVLKEGSGRLRFSSSKKSFPGEALPVWRFVTKKPVTLKEIYDYHIGLWKKVANGEILLSNTMPLPKPSSASAFSPQDTISSYFYF